MHNYSNIQPVNRPDSTNTTLHHVHEEAPSPHLYLPMDNSPDMQPTINRPDSMGNNLSTPPDRSSRIEEEAGPASLRSLFSTDSILVSCIIPPFMGFTFVTLGFYIIYGHTKLVISHSTENATLISQAFVAIFAIWHFVALIPALSVVQRVRSEEWWRRLLKTTTFNRVNSVSSNIGGAFTHAVEMAVARSSPCFKSAWIATLIVVVLADITPGAIHVEIGSSMVPASFPVPALPPNSIYSDYSKPFGTTNPHVHDSVKLAPVYFTAMATGAFVKGHFTESVLVP
jgi:hypothetical protein